MRYEIAPDLVDSDGQLANPFFTTLTAIRSEGSIAAAARRLGVSYRYLWGYLRDRESEFGRELIHWDKGRAARLTAFAERLLWAEARIMARLAPAIENLRAEISRELSVAINDDVTIIDCAASHDLALLVLRELCRAQADLLLELRFVGSIDALGELRRHRCAFAGIHLPLGRPELARRGSAIHRAFGPLLRLGKEKLLRTAIRTQGLMVAKANPASIKHLHDLTRSRFVNRPVGTGTRALLDELLASIGVATSDVPGYAHQESTHLAVAACVASGQADVGFGIAAAAHAYGLDFIPMVDEHYFLVCEAPLIDSPVTSRIIELLRSRSWSDALARLPGYRADGAGDVVSLRRTLPWYE
ncbi:MAG: helix-turn-helix transcriptional regulator [Burkholderiaceae bacterium]|nr:helix-turn-helix transcriptional regulator [Burkholderiaceae bacterium]